METRNVTLSLSTDLLRKVKVLAAQRGTSMSRLMTELLAREVGRDDDYERAKAQALEWLRGGLRLRVGERTWTRDDLHDRKALREEYERQRRSQ